MKACPTAGILVQFLDGQLGGEDDARVLAHIEDCAFCQQDLERLTDRDGTPPGIPPGRTDVNRARSKARLPATEIGVEHPHGCSITSLDGVGADESERLLSAVEFTTLPVHQPDDPTSEWNEAEEASRASSDSTESYVGAVPDPPKVKRKPRPSHWPTIAGYEILQLLGEGGMGVVYKARHLGLKRLVALKMIRGGTDVRADQLTRFRVEAEAVARLRHPNIIQIYDIGETNGLPFVALELLDGGRLDDRLARTPQPGKEAAESMVTLARAIHVAHLAGVVHRDLKPSNVLYASDGTAKITDFGLAKRIDSDDGHTASGQIMGSPSYMAPEQARGDSRKVGPVADVYALGAILYEMLTGRPPFKGATLMETVQQVLDDEPVTPSRLVHRVPRDVETICLKSLQKDPARRYLSAEAMADDLERYLRGEPILARPTPIWLRGAKWAKRRPVTATLLAVAATVLLVGFTGALEFQRRRHAAERLENSATLALQTDVTAGVLHAKDDLALNRLTEALVALTSLKERLADQPKLPGLKATVQSLLDEVEQRKAEQLARESDRRRHADFLRLRNDALFHDTQFTGLDLQSNQEETRKAADFALNLYKKPGTGESWVMASPPATLGEPERAEIADGCYTLLLVAAGAESTPEAGLRRLEQAARMRPPTRAFHLRRADCLARLGDDLAAADEKKLANQVQPATAFDHFLAGQEAYKGRDPILALRHFDKAIQLERERDQFWAHALSALCWLQLNGPVQARASLNTCLEREPLFAWLYLLRGFAASRITVASPAEAALRFESAEGDYDRAKAILDRKPNPELQYIMLVNRGILRFQHGKLGDAAADLEAAIRLSDRSSQAYAALAEVYQKQGKPDEAVAQFGLAIERKPGWAPLYRARARVRLARKDLTSAQRAMALADLDQTIRFATSETPALAEDHTSRGRLLALEDKDAEALAAWDAALAIDRNYTEAHERRIRFLLERKRYADVIRSCDALITGGKASPAIHELRGLARADRKDFAGAIEDVTNAMGERPDRGALLTRRGWLYVIADAPRLALHDFESAIALDPAIADAYNGRGYSRLRLGEHKDATADADTALAKGEPTSRLLYNAARVYALAAVVAASEARKKGLETVALVSRYEDRAAGLLRDALRRMPESQRSAFWREVIPADPALRVLRRRLSVSDSSADVRKSSLFPASPGSQLAE